MYCKKIEEVTGVTLGVALFVFKHTDLCRMTSDHRLVKTKQLHMGLF